MEPGAKDGDLPPLTHDADAGNFNAKGRGDMKTAPKTWVPVSQYDEREDKERGGPSGKYQRILFAIKRDPSPIRAYREGRLWFACKEDIEEFLSSPEEVAKTKSVAQPAQPREKQDAGLLEHIVDMRISQARCVAYLGDIYDVMETIARATEATAKAAEATAKAVEEMATRPTPASLKPTSAANGNGFHQ